MPSPAASFTAGLWNAGASHDLGTVFAGIPLQSISCGAAGHDLRFEGSLARVVCPPHCERDPLSLAFGATIHPMRSSVCEAAIVDGVMPTIGGELLVTRVPGIPSYSGKDAGVSTSLPAVGDNGDAFHEYATDIPGQASPFAPKRWLSCGVSLASLGFSSAAPGTTFAVHCPGDCGKVGRLGGSGVYTPESSVCQAALHAAVIGDAGGDAVVTVGHGQSFHIGSLSKGIQSVDTGKSSHSFTLSLPTPLVLARLAVTGPALRPEERRGVYAGCSELPFGAAGRAATADEPFLRQSLSGFL